MSAEDATAWAPDASRGTVRPVRLLGDPVLRSPAHPVNTFDGSLEALLDDMFVSMYAADGVGLAANQIGFCADVFVFDCPFDPDDENDAAYPPEHGAGYLVNSRLTRTWGRTQVWSEGCLSLPGFSWDTPRADCASVEGADVRGSPLAVSGSGLLGRCLQHESDHLLGTVYLDRLPRLHRGKAMRRYLGGVEKG